MSEVKLDIGTEAIALEAISVGNTGEAYFPKLGIRARVYAIENIRKNMDIIIVGANNSAIEHTPEELKYETVDALWQRVTEKYPLPTGGGYAVPASDRATASGNTKVVAPAAGKKLRVKFIYVFNSGAASVTVGLRFTDTGTLHFRGNLAPQTGYTLNLTGCNFLGEKDEVLYINLAVDGTVDYTVMYTEVG